ncbi:inactive tyrosine-protein kinase 7 [Acipenser ruthenus]|uniref:inactive tyrosine-protein kinase 7 n=1 Tax=Acipenser ruthenus TaxID=7906 RepID=UPI0015610719|nr:inactive tyrosine-protein kinase 7 [Acipenser ruthenus]XP_058880891.1 inactive tyrosine-protein kinase 7 [Acipenser ruthenus]
MAVSAAKRRPRQEDTSIAPNIKNKRRRVVQFSNRAVAAFAIGILCTKVLCAQAAIYFTKEPKSQDALHGRSAILRCEVENPADMVFEWLHDGVPVQDSERRFKESSNLKFTAVDRREDAGNFQCVATNTVSGDQARSTNASFNIKWLETGGVTLKEPPTVSEIQSSSPVTLRCNIDGHPRPTCQWFKDGSKLTDRIHQINNKERTLTLKSASPDDNGVYYCCAKNAVGQICSNENFTLGIIDESYPRPLIVPQDQVVNRNEEAMLHCQFTAQPPPVQEWFFEGELVTNKTRVFLFNNGSLQITQVKTRNTGVYKCVAKGPKGNSAELTATLRIADIEDMMPMKPEVFTADTMQRVYCRPPQGHPEPAVWWEREGVRIPSSGRVYSEGKELIFSPIEGGDSGTYTCLAENKAGLKKQEMTITVATKPEWVTKPMDSQLEEGKPGFLHCQTQATPDPQVTWYRNSIDISDDGRFEIFPNGTLCIHKVEVYDGTIYQCSSSTRAGRIDGQARVHVLERLKFTPPPQPLQCMELDKETSVQCSATGREKPTVQWIKADEGKIPPYVEQQGGILHFTKVTRSDAGNYTCIASNSQQGEIRAMVHLNVAVYILFKLDPENTTVYQGHTAILHCQATGDPAPSIQWKIKDKILDSSKTSPKFQKMPNGSLVINDVTTEDSGKYTCIAGNSCNIKHRDAFLYVVEKPVTKTQEEIGQTPYKMIQTIGLSVGAAVAYIIVVLGLMFYCKKRRNAKRQQKSPEGEEPEMECLNGGSAVQQNGQTTAEIQEEVALTNMGTTVTANKRHSSNDKMHFPRTNLQTITTLGKGEFGEVFLAKAKGVEDPETETVVLVKSLQTRDEQLQMDFRREFEMFGKLNHGNVVRLLGLCREAEPHYMILEYVDLGDLKQFLKIAKSKDEKIKPQPISTKQKVSICGQVAMGMEHLSNHRFVHKDLAARNCLISAQRQVKVSALSLSKDVYNSEYYHFRQAWIPLRWLPAESIFEDDFSTKSDVWSFGVLMWEVFTHGEQPYIKLTDDEVLAGLQGGKMKLPAPEGCPSKLYKLMVRCWAPSPKDRPSFSELANALGDISADSKA